ncbi:MAG: hypothetical protein JRE64_12720 [Deltaproteobacteria bacterium]|nr:hypothetical protein [Deltaproteobacteria bacterium]
MKCPHCGSKNLSKPYTDTFPENGTDDPQYSGGLIEIILVDCLDCGELAIDEIQPIT